MLGWWLWNALNDNAGGITAMATAALAVATIILVVITWRYAKKVKRQVDLLEERDRLQAKRAIRAVVAEVQDNAAQVALIGDPEQRRPFLCVAYSSSLWVINEVPMSQETRQAIARAYLCAQWYNVEHGRTWDQYRMESLARAWMAAEKSIPAALKGLGADSELKKSLA